MGKVVMPKGFIGVNFYEWVAIYLNGKAFLEKIYSEKLVCENFPRADKFCRVADLLIQRTLRTCWIPRVRQHTQYQQQVV